MPGGPTAFTETAGLLREQLREAALDHQAFETPLRPCQLATCRATCCHDGAVLSREEANTIDSLIERHFEHFSRASLTESDHPIVKRGRSCKTGTTPAASDQCAADYPAHFPRTRCIFLDHQHKCTLQLLSTSLGHHPWFYKPLSCWMHPILLRPPSSPHQRPVLTILRPAEDQNRFASCTPCGRPDPGGAPARQTLRSELIALSTIAGRDFVAELEAPPSSEDPACPARTD
ncbi:MAG: hypothetical protein GWO24_15170 [Akkermansiaceae bacterium]|nr:hypothetical protein [Akkermansiaceae bacterium]